MSTEARACGVVPEDQGLAQLSLGRLSDAPRTRGTRWYS
jgi:hypothetical protein